MDDEKKEYKTINIEKYVENKDAQETLPVVIIGGCINFIIKNNSLGTIHWCNFDETMEIAKIARLCLRGLGDWGKLLKSIERTRGVWWKKEIGGPLKVQIARKWGNEER